MNNERFGDLIGRTSFFFHLKKKILELILKHINILKGCVTPVLKVPIILWLMPSYKTWNNLRN